MMLAHRHAERPGHGPCVPGDGRPAQGVMGPHAPQAVVRPNQALRWLPRQGPPLPDTAAAWTAPWRPREPGRSRDRDPQVELHRTARLYLIGQERVHRGGQGGGGHRDPFSARVARVAAWRAPGRGIPLPPWVLRPSTSDKHA
jgi:hypothetical protein